MKKTSQALKCTLGAAVVALFLIATWSTTAARFSTVIGVRSVNASTAPAPVSATVLPAFPPAANLGSGRVFSVLPLDGGCVFDDDQPASSVEHWDVVQGKTYRVTLTNVTDCANGGTDATIKVNVKSSNTGNQCLDATKVDTGKYQFDVRMPSNACFTYPIVYCASSTCTGNDGFFARRRDGGGSTSDLRASTFDGNCSFVAQDADCASSPPQGCILTCPTVAPVCAPTDSCSAVVTYDQPTTSGECGSVSCVPPSGSTFPIGKTTVTCTATDSSSLTTTCSFDVTVNDCQDPTISCPASPVVVCNDLNQCGASVAYNVVANDNCPGVTTQCSPASGSFFSVGATTVNCTATDAAGHTATCSFDVTVNDCQAPTIACPLPITTCNTPGACSAVVNYVVTASDNCQLPQGAVACAPAAGSAFPLGTTPVNCTVTDAAGNTVACSFSVTVNDCSTGSISGKKFYDANANGQDDDGQVVAGWKVVLSGTVSATAYTDGGGNYSFSNLPTGSYTVTEVPASSSWVASSGAPCTFTINCANASNAFTCNFGNYCKTPSGGLTIGFWSNKNGQALINAGDLAALSALCLRYADGSNFDPTTNAQVRSFVLGATATNMANMLSAQLTAMVLNVRHGLVDGNAFDLCHGSTINQLITGANAALCADGYSVSGDPNRSSQEALKICLDALNNGGLDVKATPCPFTTPY